jgi:hypothetical protein
MQLYPHFSPLVAKLGGNAKVFTNRQLLQFRLYYFRRSPLAFLRFRWQILQQATLMPAARRWAARFGLFDTFKLLRAKFVGAPKSV